MAAHYIHPKLAFDIGVHRGDDTAVLLQLGFQVVSAEANATLVNDLQLRFAQEIGNGQIHLVHAAIGLKNEGEMSLFLQDDLSKSSVKTESLNFISAPCRNLSALAIEHGHPSYCKIDIEGADIEALKGMDSNCLPPFISVELSAHPVSFLLQNPQMLFATFNQLKLMAYKKFKLVDQERLTVLNNQSFYLSNLTLKKRIIFKMQKLLGIDGRSRFLRRFGLPNYAEVSGLPGQLLPGKWVDATTMQSLIFYHFEEYCKITKRTDFIFWVDLHARLD